jgi:hypothetical protein
MVIREGIVDTDYPVLCYIHNTLYHKNR